MARFRSGWLRAGAALASFFAASAAAAAEGESKFEVYGFAQADYIQDFRRVNPAWDDTLRPSKIPTQGGTFGTDGQASISVKQSRFGVQGQLPVQERQLKTRLEFDFFGVGDDEGQTTIRLRHAYGEWGQWLAGQTHSLFMDIDVFPNIIDYWGPAGMSFLRLPQIRWTPLDKDLSFAVAIEKPGNDIDPGNIRQLAPELGTNIQGDEKVPDLTAQVKKKADWGHVQLAGILRRVGFETIGTPNNGPKGFKVGWGFDLTANIKFRERDKLILSGIYGQGIASYMNDGGTDLGPEGSPGGLEPKAIPLYAGVLYYDLYWNEQFSTSIGYSRTQVRNSSFQAGDAFFFGEYASVNLLCAPAKQVLAGIELLWGRRVDRDGSSGNDVRSQISLKYSFSKEQS